MLVGDQMPQMDDGRDPAMLRTDADEDGQTRRFVCTVARRPGRSAVDRARSLVQPACKLNAVFAMRRPALWNWYGRAFHDVLLAARLRSAVVGLAPESTTAKGAKKVTYSALAWPCRKQSCPPGLAHW
jgi:hypothetical protein